MRKRGRREESCVDITTAPSMRPVTAFAPSVAISAAGSDDANASAAKSPTSAIAQATLSGLPAFGMDRDGNGGLRYGRTRKEQRQTRLREALLRAAKLGRVTGGNDTPPSCFGLRERTTFASPEVPRANRM